MSTEELKTLFETTGCTVAEHRFIKPPPLPYIVYLLEEKVRGADSICLLAEHSVTVELYSNKIDRAAESKIEEILNSRGIEYSKSRVWIDSEQFFQTTYDFDFSSKL